MAKPTISLPDELNERIESRLAYGDSKSAWIREAIEYRFACEPALEKELPDSSPEERIEFVEKAVRDAVSNSD